MKKVSKWNTYCSCVMCLRPASLMSQLESSSRCSESFSLCTIACRASSSTYAQWWKRTRLMCSHPARRATEYDIKLFISWWQFIQPLSKWAEVWSEFKGHIDVRRPRHSIFPNSQDQDETRHSIFKTETRPRRSKKRLETVSRQETFKTETTSLACGMASQQFKPIGLYARDCQQSQVNIRSW